jgi:hypothetical protein
VCGGQPSPHKPRLVVSHSTCPPPCFGFGSWFGIGFTLLLTRSFTRSSSSRHPAFTQYPFPSRSLVRDGQNSQHMPRLVVPHSKCPSLSPPPPRTQLYKRFCSNKHTHTHNKHTHPVIQPVVSHSTCPPLSSSPHAHSFVLSCIRYCSNKQQQQQPWVGSRSPDGWDQILRWAGGWLLHQPPWSFGFDSQTSGTNQGKQGATLCLKYRVPHGSISSHALPFFSPHSFHTPSLFPAFTSVWWSD